MKLNKYQLIKKIWIVLSIVLCVIYIYIYINVCNLQKDQINNGLYQKNITFDIDEINNALTIFYTDIWMFVIYIIITIIIFHKRS